MDDIERIKQLAGITEAGETFSLGKQEQIDTLVKDEAVFLRKVGQMINGLGSADLKRRLIPVLQDRVRKLDKYQQETSKGDESVPGGNFSAKA
jgi:hypothetical protein